MKLLFQGGWRAGRNPEEAKSVVEDYCRTLSKYLVASRHQLILTSSNREYDGLIAQEVATLAQKAGRNVKDILIYMLSERYTEIPSIGKVIKFEQHGHWFEERTYLIRQSDAVIAVGGGTGTLDCVQKAFLANKPVFVASAVPSSALDAWKNRPANYYYIHSGDADFVDDLNVTPEEFFSETFRILDSLEGVKYTRKVFIIHGRDIHARDCLAAILRKLQFEPIILQREPSHSLTVIEKLERDAVNAGFAFVMYTPDDLGCLKGEAERSRARQNVVFEHGLLVGLLGRERTCALVNGDIEVPSDLHGIIFQRFNNLEEESINVARTLKQAGYTVNPDALM
jgi:predicted nucleotide-binding protein/predicted Rossmann-fold nucleotide-binding protein